jgi:hypothetical protein
MPRLCHRTPHDTPLPAVTNFRVELFRMPLALHRLVLSPLKWSDLEYGFGMEDGYAEKALQGGRIVFEAARRSDALSRRAIDPLPRRRPHRDRQSVVERAIRPIASSKQSNRQPAGLDLSRRAAAQGRGLITPLTEKLRNGYVESFNAHLPDELLDGDRKLAPPLQHLADVITKIVNGHAVRPHELLGYKRPPRKSLCRPWPRCKMGVLRRPR